MSNFQPLEVVDCGSVTQPQVVENLNKFTGRCNIPEQCVCNPGESDNGIKTHFSESFSAY